MATITLLEKARQGRTAAIASLTDGINHHNVVSIFDFGAETTPRQTVPASSGSNVVQFRTARTIPTLPARKAA